MFTAFRWLRSTFISIPLIFLTTIIAAAGGIFAALLSPRSAAVDRIKRAWARAVLAGSFVRLRAEGTDVLRAATPCIFCSNHESYLDPPVLLAALAQPVRFLAKKSLFAIPLLGWAMRVEGDIAIDRDNPRSAARSLAHAAEIARGGMSLAVFPEGSRSPDGTLQAFLSGAFRLAIEAELPIVPVRIRGTREALRVGSLFIRGGQVQVMFGQPVTTTGRRSKDTAALAAAVRSAIDKM